MIDPKLDKLPVEAAGDFENIPEDQLTEEQRTLRDRRRRGLSINETVAAGPTMSVGARGFDVSGVEGGAGAGAGLSRVTPGERGESPAPNIVPGARGSGNAPRMEGTSREQPTISQEPEGLLAADRGPTEVEIATRAYQCWHERGCPEGSPEVDWSRAEDELRRERLQRSEGQRTRVAAAAR